jgi:CO/xanthine dehydrogenase FAD-binding subunit
LPPAFDALKIAALEVGSLQIQNRGTVVGNICNASPAADGVPALLTLNAQVEIGSVEGARIIPLHAFITGVRKIDLAAHEIVVALHIPEVSEQAASAFIKLGSRKHLVISIAMVATVVEMRDDTIVDVRIAVGSCSPVAKRLPELEALLVGKTWAELTCMDFGAGSVLAALTPISDVRGSAGYRLDVVPELCRRAVLEACKGS